MEKARKNACKRYFACLFLANADKHRYKNAINGLHNNFFKGLRTYPDTLDDAYTFLDMIRPTCSCGGNQYMASFAQEG